MLVAPTGRVVTPSDHIAELAGLANDHVTLTEALPAQIAFYFGTCKETLQTGEGRYWWMMRVEIGSCFASSRAIQGNRTHGAKPLGFA